MKHCSRCGRDLPTSAFYPRQDPKSKSKLRSHCRECCNQARVAAYRNRKAGIPPIVRPPYKRLACDQRDYQRTKFQTNFGARIRHSLVNGKGGVSWHVAVGYTVEDLRRHLERQFTKRMSWANYGSYWVIDHILPVSSFGCKSIHDPGFKACWALSNLRPLPKRENNAKRAIRFHLL